MPGLGAVSVLSQVLNNRGRRQLDEPQSLLVTILLKQTLNTFLVPVLCELMNWKQPNP